MKKQEKRQKYDQIREMYETVVRAKNYAMRQMTETGKKLAGVFSILMVAVLVFTSADITVLAAWDAENEQETEITLEETEALEAATEPSGEDIPGDPDGTETSTTEEVRQEEQNADTEETEQPEEITQAVQMLQERINALPSADEFAAMADGTTVEGSTLNQTQMDVYNEAQAVAEELESLPEDELGLINTEKLEKLFEYWNGQTDNLLEISQFDYITVSDMKTYASGSLQSLKVSLKLSADLGDAYGKIAVLNAESPYKYGNAWFDASIAEKGWPGLEEIKAKDPSVLAIGSGNEFEWTDKEDHTLTVTFDEGQIDLKKKGTYYVYLVTRSEYYGIYPDAILKTLTAKGDGKLYDGDTPVETGHTHSWAYEGKENSITAYCTSTKGAGQCNYQKDHAVTLLLHVDADIVYSGNAYTGATVTNNITEITGAEAGAVTYYLSDGTTQTTGSNSGAAGTGGAPVNAGSYQARISIGGATATASFTIGRKSATVTVDDAQKHIGMADPAFTYKVSGLLPGEELKDITVARKEGEGAGGYAITATVRKDSNPNYNVEFRAGTFTIEDHVEVKDAAVEATCTKTGLTEGSHCSVCNKVLVAQQTIQELGHDWSEWKADGRREKSICGRCGQSRYRTTDTSDTGHIQKDAEVAAGAPVTEAALTNKKAELIEAGGIFSEEEKTAIENGADARVWLEIATADITGADKQKVEAKAKEIVGNDVSRVVYFDVSLFKTMTQAGLMTTTQITEPGIAIEVSVKLPENLVQTDNSIARVYKIIRLHNGTADSLDAVFDKETGNLVFKTDRFSTYAIAFTDTQLVTGITLPSDDKKLTKKGETLQLTVTITPENAANKKVTWISSDSNVATVDENGLVTAVSGGTAIITAVTEDGSKTAAVKIVVELTSEKDSNHDSDREDRNPGTTSDNKTDTNNAEESRQLTAPKTGDTFDLLFWTGLLAASLAGLTGIFSARKRNCK